jgi:hypothetical protein
MKRGMQVARAGTIVLALGIGNVAGLPAAVAVPPPKPVIQILKSLLRDVHDVPTPSLGLVYDFTKLLGKPSATTEERVVARAACLAMNSVLSGTDQHDYWEDAIRAQIPIGEWGGLETKLVNGAVDRVSNNIAAGSYGPGYAKFYANACFFKKLS